MMRSHHILEIIPKQYRWQIRNSSRANAHPMQHFLLESMSNQTPGPTNIVANSLSKALMPLRSLPYIAIQTFPILALTPCLTIRVIPTLVKTSCLVIRTTHPNQDFMPFTRTSQCDQMNANDNKQFNIEHVINTFHGTTRPKHVKTQVTKVQMQNQNKNLEHVKTPNT